MSNGGQLPAAIPDQIATARVAQLSVKGKEEKACNSLGYWFGLRKNLQCDECLFVVNQAATES